MKKIFVLIVAIIGFYSTTYAQDCKVCVTINDEQCDYEGVIAYANIKITIFELPGCQGDYCEYTFNHLPYPIHAQAFNMSIAPCIFQCEDYQSVGLSATIFNTNGEAVCTGDLECEERDVTCHTVCVQN